MNANSPTVSVDLSLEQLVDALRRLPTKEKFVVWRLLGQELDRTELARKFDEALQEIRAAYKDFSEEEVMSDALRAQQEVRSARTNA
jgi:hypothetical protein